MPYVSKKGCAVLPRSDTEEGARIAIAALKGQGDTEWTEPIHCKQCGWFHFAEIDPPADGTLPHGFVRRQGFLFDVPLKAAEAFHQQRRKAKGRGIEFLFTLPEWWAWWQVDGRWERRGMGADKLVMARKGDAGPYSPENVYCATHSQNHADALRDTGARWREAFDRGMQNRRKGYQKRGAEHPKAKAVITPLGRFACTADAAKAHGCTPDTARRRAREGIKGWRQDAP